MLGTAKGSVHVLNLLNNVGFTLENPCAIIDLHCADQCLSYCSDSIVVLYDLQGERQILDYSIESGRYVRTLNQTSLSTNVLVSTSKELFIIQKGWVLTTKVLLAKVSTEIRSLAVSFPFCALANGGNVTFLKLPEGRQIWQQKDAGETTVAWITPDKCVVATCNSFKVLKVSEREENSECVVRELGCYQTEYTIQSVVTFKEEWIVCFSPDKTLRLVTQGGVVQYVEKTGMMGMMTSESARQNGVLYIISEHEILKLTTLTESERLNWHFEHEQYEEALAYSDAIQYPKADTQRRILHCLVLKKNYQEAREFLFSLLEDKVVTWEMVLEQFEKDQLLRYVCLDIPVDLMTSQIVEEVLKRLVEDSQEELILKCLERWPQRITVRKDLDYTGIMQSSMLQAKIEFALRQDYTCEALRLLLDSRSPRFFQVIDAHPISGKEFLSTVEPEQLKAVIEINEGKAVELFIANDWLDPNTIVNILSEDQAYEYMLELWKRKKRRDPGTDPVLLEQMLKRHSNDVLRFIHSSPGLNKTQALDLCKEYQNIEGQIALLQMLEKTRDVLEVPNGHIKNKLQYCHSEELWTAIINQGLKSESQAKTLISSLAVYRKPANFMQEEVLDRLPPGSYVQELGQLCQFSKHSADMYRLALTGYQKQSYGNQAELTNRRKEGVYVEHPPLCNVCGKVIYDQCIFRPCGHHSHPTCNETRCRVCKPTRKLP